MPHGGKRPGAGRPGTQVDEKRIRALLEQKISRVEIARRFGVSEGVIKYAIHRMRKKESKQ